LQHNVMVFIAELFWWFEIVKPQFVQPRDVQEFKDGEEFFFYGAFVILLCEVPKVVGLCFSAFFAYIYFFNPIKFT